MRCIAINNSSVNYLKLSGDSLSLNCCGRKMLVTNTSADRQRLNEEKEKEKHKGP